MRFVYAGCILALSAVCNAGAENLVYNDTSDPLFLLREDMLLSESKIVFAHSDNNNALLRLGQAVSYGINDRFSVGINVHYQFDFDGSQDGFSSFDLGGVYRLDNCIANSSDIISDVLFGFKFGGSSHVRMPWFADSTYYAGLRFGKQWNGVTLSGTVKSSWIFDDKYGMSYIDFIPEVYFRLVHDFKFGIGATIRAATNDYYNQEWIDSKFVAQFGRTQYIALLDYEFENNEIQIGAKLNILF
ncbi:MAG: hypothetical protein ACLRFI_01355 [Alphaproteobacteria bacterium]